MSGFGRVVRGTVGVVLLGSSGYLTLDALNDALVYRICKRLALDKARGDIRLQEELGQPMVTGPWYNASVGLTYAGHIASCTFTVNGSKASSDIYVRVIRKGGQRSTLLYNLIGRAQWEVLLLEASVGGDGGLSRTISLVSPLATPAGSPQTQPLLQPGKDV